MAVVQKTYGNMSDNVKTSRPKVESRSDGKFRIAFDDDKRARDVAVELARLLFCSPDDFACGDREGKPIYICAEDTIIECALAIAHLRLRYPLPPQPIQENAAVAPNEERETISLPDGKTVTLRSADHTLVVEHEGVWGSIRIDLSQLKLPYGVGIQVGTEATNLNSYAEPKLAFDALLSALASATKRAPAAPQKDIASEKAVSAKRREAAWNELCHFMSSLSGDD